MGAAPAKGARNRASGYGDAGTWPGRAAHAYPPGVVGHLADCAALPGSPAIETRRFLLVKPVAAGSVCHRVLARVMTLASPKRSAGVLRTSASAEGCVTPLKAGLARTVP